MFEMFTNHNWNLSIMSIIFLTQNRTSNMSNITKTRTVREYRTVRSKTRRSRRLGGLCFWTQEALNQIKIYWLKGNGPLEPKQIKPTKLSSRNFGIFQKKTISKLYVSLNSRFCSCMTYKRGTAMAAKKFTIKGSSLIG